METVACELCGSDRPRVFLRQRDLTHGVSDEEFTVVRRGVCGFLYLNPRPGLADMGPYPTQYFSDLPPRSRTALEQSAKRVSQRIKRSIMKDYYGYSATATPSRWRRFRKVLLWPAKVHRIFRGREGSPPGRTGTSAGRGMRPRGESRHAEGSRVGRILKRARQ